MTQTTNPLLSLMGLIRNGGNPQVLINQLAANDPQVRQAVQMIQGKSQEQLKQMVTNMAKERGISVNDIARQLGITIPSDK